MTLNFVSSNNTPNNITAYKIYAAVYPMLPIVELSISNLRYTTIFEV